MNEESTRRLDNLREYLARMQDYKTVRMEESPPVEDKQATEEAEAFSQGQYDDLERKRTEAETRTIAETNLDRRVNRKLRWNYAKKVYCYLIAYSVVVALLLVLHGFSWIPFTLPESVLDFLVGSTAAARNRISIRGHEWPVWSAQAVGQIARYGCFSSPINFQAIHCSVAVFQSCPLRNCPSCL